MPDVAKMIPIKTHIYEKLLFLFLKEKNPNCSKKHPNLKMFLNFLEIMSCFRFFSIQHCFVLSITSLFLKGKMQLIKVNIC